MIRTALTVEQTSEQAEPFRPFIPAKQREKATDLLVVINASETADEVSVTVYYRGAHPDGLPHKRRSSILCLLTYDSPWLPLCFRDHVTRTLAEALPHLRAKREKANERNQMLGIGVT